MFYSKALLSKKGPLGPLWVAGVCGVAALTREQVVCTDVAASVDKILPDVETAYRILGLLLLGVVRIYSKKVEFLCHDCDRFLESFESAHCTERGTSTGRAMNRVLKQVKKGVRAKNLVIDQQDIQKVKKPVRSARTSEVSCRISSEAFSSRTEIGITLQMSVEVREAQKPADPPIPVFTIPKRFELDSFDLQIDENRDDDDDDDHHQLPRQDTLLEDEQHCSSYLYESYRGMTCSYDLDSACFMSARIFPTELISVISEVNNLPYSSNSGDELERDIQNADSACFTPVKDVLSAEMMAEVGDPSEKSKTMKARREVNKDSACSIPLLENPEIQRTADVVENVSCLDPGANGPTIGESENGFIGKSNTAPSVGSSYHNIEEQESLEPPIIQCQIESLNVLPPSTPEPSPPGITGLPYSPKIMVTTPANNEKRYFTRKRRRGLYNQDFMHITTDRKDKRKVRRRGPLVLYDKDIVLPNDMMRRAIEDASDLVYKRRKAPHTYLDAWKEARISSLPHTLMDPLLPYSTSLKLGYSTTLDSCSESVKAKKCLLYELAESNNSCKDAQNAEKEGIIDEPRKRNLDELPNSIQTPVGCYTGIEQFQEDTCGFNGDTATEKNIQVNGYEPNTTGIPEERLYESQSHSPLRSEALNAAIDNIEADIPIDEENTRDEGLGLSTRTRTVARCLHQLFSDQKSQQENVSVTLRQALEGRKRKTTARFFYETLILKSRGLIEISQELPYEDIVISETPQLAAL